MIPRFLLLAVSLIGAAGLPGPAFAQAIGDDVLIESGSATGVIRVNVAAGNFNQQANAAVVAAGGNSDALATIWQFTDDAADSPGAQSVAIAPNSFVGSAGLISVNGAAGSGNQQANLAAIAIGMTGVALGDTALSQARASHEPSSPDKVTAVNDRSVAIGTGAFAQSSGLIQVSLIGGDRNSSANTFAVSSTDGAGL